MMTSVSLIVNQINLWVFQKANVLTVMLNALNVFQLIFALDAKTHIITCHQFLCALNLAPFIIL